MVFSSRSKTKGKKNSATPSSPGPLTSPRRRSKDKEKPGATSTAPPAPSAAPSGATAAVSPPIPISFALLEPPPAPALASSGSRSPTPFSGSPLLAGKNGHAPKPCSSSSSSAAHPHLQQQQQPPRELALGGNGHRTVPSWRVNGQPGLSGAEVANVSNSPLPSPWVEEALLSNTAYGFSEHQLQTLKEAFNFFDIDRDGRITCPELLSVFKFLGSPVTEDEVALMISEADIDGNGTVELNEFLRMMRRYYHKHEPPSTEEEEMWEAFKAFDHNGDCYIDFDEIKNTMHFLGEAVSDEEVRAMINEADVDKDGRINFEEFKKMMSLMRMGGSGGVASGTR